MPIPNYSATDELEEAHMPAFDANAHPDEIVQSDLLYGEMIPASGYVPEEAVALIITAPESYAEGGALADYQLPGKDFTTANLLLIGLIALMALS